MKQLVLSVLICLVAFSYCTGTAEGSDLQGGIIVHLNCGDGEATAAMSADNNCLIHGLDQDAANISKARAYLRAKDLYGRVSVACYEGESLPYGDNMVNLLVADSPGDVALQEVMRVLVPGGTAMIGGNKTVKPWPREADGTPMLDDWPQYLNKADNNAVAMDSVAGPPRRLQWCDEPLWSRSHMGISTIASVVTAGGRLFSIEDRSLPDNPFLPGNFMYVARDAFNGRTLWTRKIKQWESVTTYIKCLPTQQQRRMVATDDILYCTPVLEGPLAALDAATGKTLRTYEDIAPVQEVAYDAGILFVNVGDRFSSAAYNQTNKKGSFIGTPGEPFNGAGFRRGYAPEIEDKMTPISAIVAVDPKDGRQLWKTRELKNYTGASFSVKGDHAVYQTAEGMFCLNSKTGEELWSLEKAITNQRGHDSGTPGTMPGTVIITDDKAFAIEGKNVCAYSLEDGKILWEAGVATNYESSADLFYIDGLVWVGGAQAPTALDAETGEVVKTLKQQITGPMSHDRCYRNLITKDFYINSKTGGADFVNLESGSEHPNHWTRGCCGMGVLPANGLLYSTPYSCTCSVGDMLPGMNAYSADAELLRTCDSSVIRREVRLEKGPAYGEIGTSKTASPDDWPTYRGNTFRGGMTRSTIVGKLNVKWQTKLPTTPTASTVADGKVFVCDADTHALYALDSETGKTLWTFTADGRIDSPPTYHKGMVLFGARDGWLYCLRAEDGQLAWRFKDLPDRLIGAFGQLESAWPISGSVLVLDDKVYAAAGRTSFLDGGMFLYCLDPASGELLVSRSAFGPFAKDTGFPIGFKATPVPGGTTRRGKKEGEASESILPGFRNDVLTTDGINLYLRHAAFDKDLVNSKTTGLHLMPLGGFLDQRVQHRTGFILNDRFQWWRNEPKDIMISDGQEAYAVAGFQSTHNHAYFDPRTNAYMLTGKNVKTALPINGRALAKAGDVLVVAGEPMKFKDPTWQSYVSSYNGALGASIVLVSAVDGKEIASYKLPSAPVWDSIAIAQGRIYISLADGTIQCMGR